MEALTPHGVNHGDLTSFALLSAMSGAVDALGQWPVYVLVIYRCANAIVISIFGHAEYEPVKGKPFPSLIDVTLEDLSTGLESGQFTSVDLVNVR